MTLTVTPPQPDYKKVWTLFRRPVTPGPEVVPRREVVFHGADPDTSYTVKVTLVLNGQAIAVSQELTILPHRKCIVNANLFRIFANQVFKQVVSTFNWDA